MKDFPNLQPLDQDNIVMLLKYILKERPLDISDFNNLKNRFTGGRTVGKVPTGASDIDPTDRIGDENYDYASGYFYRLVDNAGTAVWARIALDTTW